MTSLVFSKLPLDSTYTGVTIHRLPGYSLYETVEVNRKVPGWIVRVSGSMAIYLGKFGDTNCYGISEYDGKAKECSLVLVMWRSTGGTYSFHLPGGCIVRTRSILVRINPDQAVELLAMRANRVINFVDHDAYSPPHIELDRYPEHALESYIEFIEAYRSALNDASIGYIDGVGVDMVPICSTTNYLIIGLKYFDEEFQAISESL